MFSAMYWTCLWPTETTLNLPSNSLLTQQSAVCMWMSNQSELLGKDVVVFEGMVNFS